MNAVPSSPKPVRSESGVAFRFLSQLLLSKFLLPLAVILAMAQVGWGQPWSESFDSQTSGSYGTGTISINSRDWTRKDAGNFSYANSTMGSYAFTINDDKSGAHITTPALNTCGTVSFKYAYKSGNSTNVFKLQKSYNNTTWTDLETHTLGTSSEENYVSYSYDVNDGASTIYIRILSDDQNAHLFIEDFSVTAYSSCSGQPTAQATNISFSGETASSIDVSWDAGTGGDSYILVAREANDVSWTPTDGTDYSAQTGSGDFSAATDQSNGNKVIYSGSGTSTTVTGLTASTTYHFQVFHFCSNASTDYLTSTGTGNDGTQTGTTAAVSYCASSGNMSYGTAVTLVNLNDDINNSTGTKTAAYNDYTAQSADLARGSSYNLTVNLFTDGGYEVHSVAWIDWNQDGDFDDTDETIDMGHTSTDGATNLSPKSITVPATAALGNTRMRVSAKYGSDPTSCEEGFDGEVEDYTINVTASGSTPTITVSESAVNFNNVYAGNASLPELYTVEGTDLTADITITAPTGYEVSTSCSSGYGSSVTLAQSGGTVSQTTVYLRFAPSGTSTYSGNVTHESTGATTQNIAVNETNTATNLPGTYYSTATGTGRALITNLHNIIDQHTERTYDNLWTDFQTTDDRANGTVWDMYSDNVCSTDPYEFTFITEQCGSYGVEGDCYNREHSFPKSWWGGVEDTMYTDLFHLVPTDGKVNGQRGSWEFGEVGSPTWTSQNGSKLGPNTYSGSSGATAFEPIDDYKGDFARAYFYMAVRYASRIQSWTTSPMVDGDINDADGSVFEEWALNMLIEWHTNDPVDQKELNRNDAIYSIQGNRNPFIDNPSYVDAIWGANPALAVSPASLTGFSYEEGSGPSTSQSFALSGTDLDGTEVTLTAPTNYEISTDNSTFQSSLTVSYTAPTLSSTTIYVRLKAGLSAATYNGETVTCNDNGTASNVTVSNDGEVTSAGGGGAQTCEDFDDQSGTTYVSSFTTDDFGTWTASQAGNFDLGTPRNGASCVAINDDKSGAHITTPSFNTVGTVTFWYYQRSGSASDQFEFQVSEGGGAFTTLQTQGFDVGTTYTEFSYNVNSSNSDVKIRVLNNNQDGHLIIDDFCVSSYGSSNDNDTEVYEPTTQISGANIASTETGFSNVFSIEIQDQGTADGEVTDVTNIRLKPHTTNTADWTDHISAIKLNNGSDITLGTVDITDTYIDIAIPAGNLQIADGGSDVVTVQLKINNTGITDGAVLSFMVDADDHGFTADASGSDFASSFFLGDFNSNDFTIDVTFDELRFTQQPTDVNVSVAMTPAVTVAATDANGNVDTDFDGSGCAVGLTTTGTFAGSATTQVDAASGIATFDNLVFSVSGTGITLTTTDPDSWGWSNITSTTFDVTAGPMFYQDFGADGGNWSYTPNPATFNSGSDVWDVVTSSFHTFGTIPSSKSNFFGVQDLDSPSGTSGWGTLTFDQVSIAGYANVAISFDYEVDGFDNGDDLKYEYFVDGTSQGETLLVEGNSGLDADGTVTLNIPDGSSSVQLIISFNQNGDDYGAIDNVKITGDAVACEEPTTQPSALNFTGTTDTETTLDWTNGNGYRRLVVVREGSAVSFTPVDNTTYTANSDFSAATSLDADNNKAVYASAGNTFTVSGLNGGTTYHFAIFEYGCLDGSEDYLTTSPLTGTVTTDVSTVSNLSVGCEANTTATITWDAPTGDYDGVVIAVRQGNDPAHALSVDPTLVAPASSTFGNGYEFGSTTPYSYVVYKGTGTNVTVDGLTAGEEYRIKAYAYKGTVWANTQPTTSISGLAVPNASTLVATAGNTEVTLTWVNPETACFDEIMVVAKAGSAPAATPSGNGGAYTADAAFGSGTEIAADEFVVYKSTGNNFTTTTLTNGTEYYFTIFTRTGSEWSTGVTTSATPNTVAVFDYGDLAIVAVNTDQSLIDGVEGDEISFVCFVDVTTGTAIDFTDNGYERATAGYWGDTEGTLRFTRTGGTVPAGAVITFIGKQGGDTPTLGTDFNIYLDGVLDNANWDLESLNGSSSFDLNTDDQIWMMQGGEWIAGAGSHDAEYTGKVLYGWTATGWEPSPGYNDTKGSTLYPGGECSETNVTGLTNKDKVKYTGTTTDANRQTWIDRINNSGNWTDYSSNANFDAGTPQYRSTDVDFGITAAAGSGISWEGTTDDDWFNCANWSNRRVPDQTVDVTVDNTASNDAKIDVAASPNASAGDKALCNNLTIDGRQVILQDSRDNVLEVHGNLTIAGGATLNMGTADGTNDGQFYLYGNWANNGDKTNFEQGDGLVQFMGTAQQTLTTSDPSNTETFHDVTLNNASGLALNDDMEVEGALTLTNGLIATGNQKVVIENTATGAIAGHSTSSYINGNLRRHVATLAVAYDFPVGTASQYELAQINLSSVSGLSYFDAKFTAPNTGTAPADGILLDYGYWTLQPDAGTINSQVILTSRGHTNGAGTTTLHQMLTRPDAASDWVDITTTNQSGTGTAAISVEGNTVPFTAGYDFAIMKIAKVWDGSENTAWGTADNWTPSGIPASGDDVVIPVETNQPAISTETAATGDLVIQENAELTLTGGSLNVSGDLTLESATDNSGGETLTGAIVDNTTSGAVTVNGTTYVKRFLADAGIYHYVSSPLDDARASIFDDGNGLSTTNKLYKYNAGVEWVRIETGSTVLASGMGLAFKSENSNHTYTFTGGSLNTGAISLPVSGGGNSKNLVGNPYPSVLDWNALTKANIQGSTYYVKTGGSGGTGGTVRSWDGTAGTNGATQYIAPLQSFWVLANSSPALDADNSARVTNTATFWKDDPEINNIIRLTASNASQTYSDETVVYFRDMASNEYDSYDSDKMFGTGSPEIYTMAGQHKIAINKLATPFTGDLIVPVGLRITQAGSVSITATQHESFEDNTTIYLVDNYAGESGKWVNLTVTPQYTFNSDVYSGEDRFFLYFAPISTSVEDEPVDGEISIFSFEKTIYVTLNNPAIANGKLFVYNLLGELIVEKSGISFGTTAIGIFADSGCYIVKIKTKNSTVTQKVILH